MSSSAAAARARRSGRQFPVGGRWRHVPVVDTGCGCRPRRPRQLLMSLPSFLRPSPKPPVPRSTASSQSSSSFFPASSVGSFSSSSAATFTSTYSSSSNYHFPSSSHAAAVYDKPAHAAVTKQASPSPSPAPASRKKAGKKKRYDKMAAASATAAAAAEVEEEDVGVAVEKESSDPRADFRESMVAMVVEMGLCGWDDLRCMLRRLLALNAPRHHAAILTAFAEVCAQLAAPPPPPPPAAYHYQYYHY